MNSQSGLVKRHANPTSTQTSIYSSQIFDAFVQIIASTASVRLMPAELSKIDAKGGCGDLSPADEEVYVSPYASLIDH